MIVLNPNTMNNASPTKLLSIVLPAYNEQDVLPLTYERFTAMRDKLAEIGLDYELVFVNDGSRDNTPDMLDEMAGKDPHVRTIHLARNFGHQAAVTAGLQYAKGDVIAVMDCDLQDPPEVLPQFLARWADGYQVVYAIRTKRKEWFGKRFAYWAFYRTLRWMSDIEIPLDSGDFCVMDRSAVELLNSLPEKQRFVRGLRTWVGLKQTGQEYERDARAAGVPQYTFRKLLKLATDGLISFSSAPLQMVTRLGIFSLFAAIAITIWVIIAKLSGIEGTAGWASLVVLMLMIGSAQMISLGIIGSYLARIFLEVKARPTYLIARVVEQTADQAAQQESPSQAASQSTVAQEDPKPESSSEQTTAATTRNA